MSWFHGLNALLASRRRRILILVGAVSAVLTGIAALGKLTGANADDFCTISAIAFYPYIIFTPLLMGMDMTLVSGKKGTTGRRLELLSLPLGRLAIPSALLLSSLITILLLCFVTFAILGVPVQHVRLFAEFLDEMKDMRGTVAISSVAFGIFSVIMSVTMTGNHSSSLSLLWLAVTFSVAAGSFGAGYSEVLVALPAMALATSSFYLTMPFLLYARDRHHWAPCGQLHSRESFDALALVTLALVVPIWTLLGFGWTFVIVGGVGFSLCRSAWKTTRHHARTRSHLRVVNLSALAFYGPTILALLFADAMVVRNAVPQITGRTVESVLAPDGRHMVLLTVPHWVADDERHEAEAIRRATVVDLQGKRPPLTLPPRFAHLRQSMGIKPSKSFRYLQNTMPASCWSKDGRFLAVTDRSMGVFYVDNQFDASMVYQRHGALAARWMDQFAKTWIYDTHSGELTEHASVQLAPGWNHPNELVHLSSSLLGSLQLETGSGLSLDLPFAMGCYQVTRYRDGGFEMDVPERLLHSAESGQALQISKTSSKRALFKDGRWIEPPQPGVDAWTLRPDRDAKKAAETPGAKAKKVLVARKGTQRREYPYVGTWVRLRGQRLTFFQDDGLKSVDLDQDSLKTLIAFSGPPDGEPISPLSRNHAVTSQGGRFFGIDLQRGICREIAPLGEGQLVYADQSVALFYRAASWHGRERQDLVMKPERWQVVIDGQTRSIIAGRN